MKNFYLKSLGCKQNQLEGQIIADSLKSIGFIETELKKADIFLINSCSVTSQADSTVNYLYNHAKKTNPNIKVALLGCVSQTYKEHSTFVYSNYELVLGNKEKMDIVNYINKEGFFVGDIIKEKTFDNKFLLNPTSTRVSIKIQDGCNNNCSYCIIPYARGKSRSNSVDNIINQIELVCAKGIKEIVLTGIHIGQWGFEFNQTLVDLLKIIEQTKIARYRLGSLYINELDDKTIDFLAQSDKFCPHFHLSLQSLCDKTLKAMNRNYSSACALNTIKKLHKKFNNPYLGCDIIAGFPLETDDDFNITLNNLKKAKLSSIHCFPYSRRENTPAYYMEQVQDSIKTKRVEKILELSKKLHKDFLDKNKSENAEVLIEKRSKKTGLYTAVTRNYIKIFIDDKNDNLRHTLRTVNLADYELM